MAVKKYKNKRYLFYLTSDTSIIKNIKEHFPTLYKYLFGAIDKSILRIKFIYKNNFLIIQTDKDKLYNVGAIISILKATGVISNLEYLFTTTTIRKGLEKGSNV